MKNVMQRHEDPLDLQSLPLVSPAKDAWPVIEAALRSDGRQRMLRRYAVTALAAAATVMLAIGLVRHQPITGSPAQHAEPSVSQAANAEGPPGASPSPLATDPGPADGAETLQALIALSQRLEGRLRTIRADVGDLPASTVVYQVELEDLVVQVDDALSMEPDSLALWSHRVNLLMDLQRLYENRLRREYQQIASL